MSIDAQSFGMDALREVHTLSGLSEDVIALEKANQSLMEIYTQNQSTRTEAKVILELMMARWYNSSILAPMQAGIKREEHLLRATNLAKGNNTLMMQVHSERALLYADKKLNLDSRKIRQEACQSAVEFCLFNR